jgi:hypothetical protein
MDRTASPNLTPDDNRERLLATLLPVLIAYEARYDLPSARVPAELRAGRLRDSDDVRDWLETWHACRALVRGATTHG